GLDDLLLAGLVEFQHLVEQPRLAVRAFLGRPAHPRLPPRRRTIILPVDLLRRVRYPSAGLPQGVCGFPPAPDRPSPPPWGWSNGFIDMPRTAGRLPRQRLLPALPTFSFSCSTLPIWPTVA